MDWMVRLGYFDVIDGVALALLLACWLGSSWVIENPPARRMSVSKLMTSYRRRWMHHFITRQPRIFDANIVGSLRQSTAFFASAAMIAISGIFALLGDADRLRGVAGDFADTDAPVFVWEAKLLLRCKR